jgi:hypothetical protein
MWKCVSTASIAACTARGVPTPNGVGHTDLLHADLAHQTRYQTHTRGRDLTLIGTAHRTRDSPPHRHARGHRSGHHRPKALDALRNRTVDVFLAESFTGRAEHHNSVCTRSQCGFQTLHIRNEGGVAHIAFPGIPRITSALSAICGTHSGLTKLVTSMSFRPAACKRCTSSILTAAGTGCFSFCKPSRGPTSVM